jgi:predicted small secreted protein
MKRPAIKRNFALLLLALFSMHFLAACHTMEGVGEDVQTAGEKIEGQAQDCQEGDC